MSRADKITITLGWLFLLLVIAVLATGVTRLLGISPNWSQVVSIPMGLYFGIRCSRMWRNG